MSKNKMTPFTDLAPDTKIVVHWRDYHTGATPEIIQIYHTEMEEAGVTRDVALDFMQKMESKLVELSAKPKLSRAESKLAASCVLICAVYDCVLTGNGIQIEIDDSH